MQSIDVLLETAREFLHQVAALLPRLALALMVVIAGWLVAKAIRFAVEKALRAANFNVLTERAGTDHFLQQGGLRGDTTTLFGLLAYWLVILAALIIAFNGLGLTYITDLLQRAAVRTQSAGRVAGGGLRFLLRALRGRRGDHLLHRGAGSNADLLGKIAQYLIMAFVVMIALSQVEVGGDIVQRTFLVILAGVVLALALAFGLGGKEWAASLLERWWPRHRGKDDL